MLEANDNIINKTTHYAAIDGLRAFSAIGIVLMHVLANGKYSFDGFIFGSLIPSFTNLVFLFMIISGFAMCCGYYDKIINNEITVGEFFSKRYAKMWPYFALLCVLDLLVSPSVNSLYEGFANLTLCFGLLPNANISVIGVGWFLGLVFVFYLLFPFFCYLLSDRKRAWFSFVIVFAFNILCSDYFDINRTNIMYSAVFFMTGGLIYIYREQLERVAKKKRWTLWLLCVGATISYYILGPSVSLMLILFSLYLIYALGVSREGLLENTITRFLSSISMEIYLSHMVIYRVMEKVGVLHIFGESVLSYALGSIGTLVGTVVFAVVAKKGLEKLSKFKG